MVGDVAAVDRGARAYAAGLRLFDRAEVSDVLHLVPAVSAVMTERWEMLDAPTKWLEYCAERGSRLAGALLEATAEERAGDLSPR